MARRFPDLELVGVEFEADSVARARANVAAAGLADRITIRQAERRQGRARPASTTSPTSSTRCTSWPTRRGVAARRLGGAPTRRPADRARLAAAVGARRSSGRRHGELIAGVQLDELYQGTALATREQFLRLVRRGAACPSPLLIDLPSGASLFVVERPH